MPSWHEEQAYVHETYMTELVAGRFEASTRERFLDHPRPAAAGEDRRRGARGTELPLLLRGTGVEGVEMLDTTALHVEAIVGRMFG